MKVAAPFAGGFLAYLGGLLGAIISFKTARNYFYKSKYLLASILVVAGLTAGAFSIMSTETESYAFSPAGDSLFVPTEPPNTPMGTAKGIFPGRVVWNWDSTAATWNGTSGNWWSDSNTHQAVVDSMLCQSLRALTGKTTDQEAWDTLFKYFNMNHGKGNIGYQNGEKIAIKINLVQSSSPGTVGNKSFVPPQFALSLLRQLVNVVGVKDSNITFYDTDRFVPDPVYTKCKNAYPGVHFMGWVQSGGREKYVRDTTRIHWAENLTEEINGGHPAFLPTSVTKASYLINLADFKAHRYMGVTFCSKNHFGTLSVDGNNGREYQDAPHAAGLHYYTAVHDIYIEGSPEWTFKGRPMGTYNTLVDLMGHKDLGAKTLLFIIEAFYGVQYEGCPVGPDSKWQMAPFNDNWTSSLFLSQDNVAIESVGLDFFRTEQSINPNYTYTYGAVDNYLHEAALADNPPSGTVYDPEHDGISLQSLGVHEHWNNATEKQYTRNLGTGNGIELVSLTGTVTSIQEEKRPSEFALFQNYPNPFNPSTTITYHLSKRSTVSLDIFDAAGRKVANLAAGAKPAGTSRVQFDGSSLPSGIYFYRLLTRDNVQTKKLVLLK
jgi:hypothetical protein